MTNKEFRINELLDRLSQAPPADTGLLAYKLISTTLNEIEDFHLGAASWSPPRRFGEGVVSNRLYPSYPDCMFPVEDWPGVTMVVHMRQLIFIGNRGAFQIQRRNDSPLHFSERREMVLLDKPDALGNSVWDRNK